MTNQQNYEENRVKYDDKHKGDGAVVPYAQWCSLVFIVSWMWHRL